MINDMIDQHNLDLAFSLNYQKGLKRPDENFIKNGISTVASYRGAQLFEIVGLDKTIVDLCFTGTTNRIQGASFDDLQAEQQHIHNVRGNGIKA